MASQLVIVRHYEPLPPEEAEELLHRVYDRLFDAALLERLTRPGAESTIPPGENGKGASDESSKVRES
jgi:hypothetical protein